MPGNPDKEKKEAHEACHSTVQRFLKSVDNVSCKIGFIGIIAILVMMTITVVDVILRWFGLAIIGTMEVTELLLGVMAFFSFSWCYCEDKHLKIEVLAEQFPERARCVTSLLGALVGLIFFGAVMWGSFGLALDAYTRKEISPLLKIPLFPVKIIIMIASCIFFLQLLSSVLDRITRVAKGD